MTAATIDAATFRALQDSTGADFVRELVSTFLEELPGMSTSMHYPCNYGYVPRTLSDDGDPSDVLVLSPMPLITGVVVRCRPIGMDALPDFVKLAEAYGHVGLKIERPGDVEGALKEALKQKDRLVFLDFITDQAENVFPMIPGGKGLTEMILAEEL